MCDPEMERWCSSIRAAVGLFTRRPDSFTTSPDSYNAAGIVVAPWSRSACEWSLVCALGRFDPAVGDLWRSTDRHPLVVHLGGRSIMDVATWAERGGRTVHQVVGMMLSALRAHGAKA